MANPILSGPDNSNNSRMGLLDLLSIVKGSPNPETAMREMMVSDPRFRNIAEYIEQNGGDARTAFYNLAAKKGVDPDSILRQLR